jgi:hypothetical protein
LKWLQLVTAGADVGVLLPMMTKDRWVKAPIGSARFAEPRMWGSTFFSSTNPFSIRAEPHAASASSHPGEEIN